MSDSKGAKIVRRTKVGLVLTAVLAGLLALSALPEPWGPRLVLVVCAAASVGAAFELARMGLPARGASPAPFAVGSVACALVAFALYDPASRVDAVVLEDPARYWWSLVALPAAAVVFAMLAALPALGAPGARRTLGLVGLVLALWLCVPLSGLYLVRLYLGTAGLVAVLALSKIGDVAGYFVGNFLGRTHPFPRISPGKTTAGCVASLVAGTAAGAACQLAGWLPEPRLGLLSGLMLGALVNLAAQAGDLVESIAKRRAGVKDSGTTFGPSGGLLDLVDSLLLSVPVALLVLPALYEWPYRLV